MEISFYPFAEQNLSNEYPQLRMRFRNNSKNFTGKFSLKQSELLALGTIIFINNTNDSGHTLIRLSTCPALYYLMS